MRRAFFCLLLLIIAFSTLGQAPSEYVRFYGRTLKAKDSAAITASIYYEKLPYYDDMGTGRSNPEGRFEFYLLNGLQYNFKVTADGLDPFEQQVTISDQGQGSMEQLFLLVGEPEVLTLENLIFSRGSDQISESSFSGLDELVTWLDGRPSMVIQLEGHTDFAGNPEANMKLSEARVEAVKAYLVKKGINKDRILTKAFGGEQPLSIERTDEARTRNRRVEVRVIRK